MSSNAEIISRPKAPPMILFMILLGVSPVVLSHPFYRHVLTMIFLFASISGAWNLISGYGGLFSLAHAAFFGVGAYATVIPYVDYGISPWFGLLIGGMFGMVGALIIGFTTFRLRQFFSFCRRSPVLKPYMPYSLTGGFLCRPDWGRRFPVIPE